MANDNPYDLTKLVTMGGLIEKHKYKPEVFTGEEQKEMLRGFERVPKESWTMLAVGTFIRYIRKDGEMRKGGYIRYIDPAGEFMSVSLTPPAQQSKTWRLPLSGVAQIWRSLGPVVDGVVMQTQVRTRQPQPAAMSTDLADTVAALKEDIRQLKIEIQRVMNQQKRIIKSVGVNAVRLDRIESRGR
jgi:hypothetical protein